MKIILFILITLSADIYAQVDKIKVVKEKNESLPDVNCPFVFKVDSIFLNRKLNISNVMFKGKGLTRDDLKRLSQNSPFKLDTKYLITYKSIQNGMKDWCKGKTYKLMEVEITPINDTILSLTGTFFPK